MVGRKVKAMILGAIPWIAYVVVSPLLNKPVRIVAGVPLIMLWDIIWMPLTTICLYIAYKIEFG